jgi:hypothetical protein
MAVIGIEINGCAECPFKVVVDTYTTDGFDSMEDWACSKKDNQSIQKAVEWHEEKKIQVPTWCPIVINP